MDFRMRDSGEMMNEMDINFDCDCDADDEMEEQQIIDDADDEIESNTEMNDMVCFISTSVIIIFSFYKNYRRN